MEGDDCILWWKRHSLRQYECVQAASNIISGFSVPIVVFQSKGKDEGSSHDGVLDDPNVPESLKCLLLQFDHDHYNTYSMILTVSSFNIRFLLQSSRENGGIWRCFKRRSSEPQEIESLELSDMTRTEVDEKYGIVTIYEMNKDGPLEGKRTIRFFCDNPRVVCASIDGSMDVVRRVSKSELSSVEEGIRIVQEIAMGGVEMQEQVEEEEVVDDVEGTLLSYLDESEAEDEDDGIAGYLRFSDLSPTMEEEEVVNIVSVTANGESCVRREEDVSVEGPVSIEMFTEDDEMEKCGRNEGKDEEKNEDIGKKGGDTEENVVEVDEYSEKVGLDEESEGLGVSFLLGDGDGIVVQKNVQSGKQLSRSTESCIVGDDTIENANIVYAEERVVEDDVLKRMLLELSTPGETLSSRGVGYNKKMSRVEKAEQNTQSQFMTTRQKKLKLEQNEDSYILSLMKIVPPDRLMRRRSKQI